MKHSNSPVAPQPQPASSVSHDRPSRRLASGAASLVDVLELVLDKGLVIAGDIKVSLADIELLTIRIRLIVCSIDKAEQIGLDWWKHDRHLSPGRAPVPQKKDAALRKQPRVLARQVAALERPPSRARPSRASKSSSMSPSI